MAKKLSISLQPQALGAWDEKRPPSALGLQTLDAHPRLWVQRLGRAVLEPSVFLCSHVHLCKSMKEGKEASTADCQHPQGQSEGGPGLASPMQCMRSSRHLAQLVAGKQETCVQVLLCPSLLFPALCVSKTAFFSLHLHPEADFFQKLASSPTTPRGHTPRGCSLPQTSCHFFPGLLPWTRDSQGPGRSPLTAPGCHPVFCFNTRPRGKCRESCLLLC